MSKETIIVARRLPDGTLVEELPDGSTRPLPDQTDWERLRAMTDEEVEAAALSDPDNPPLTVEQLRRMRRGPNAKFIRRNLGLTQEAFAARFRIPLATLRDWEQGKSEPDQAARAYLTVIARDPEAVLKALAPPSAGAVTDRV